MDSSPSVLFLKRSRAVKPLSLGLCSQSWQSTVLGFLTPRPRLQATTSTNKIAGFLFLRDIIQWSDAMTLLELHREKEPWKSGDMASGPTWYSDLCSLGHVDEPRVSHT